MTWWRGRTVLRGLARGCLFAAGLLGMVIGVAQGQPVAERPDVRVIVDVSGSMRHNDPDQLAASALELLASLLPDGTRAGVWTFGEWVENPLPLAAVDDDWRARAMALRPRLVEYQPFTDIEAAVREAAENPANGWRHLVLLTDGVVDLPPARGAKPAVDDASRRALLDELAPALAERGVVVHAIAFSDEADLALVERLSQVTGGLPALVQSPESLLGAFVDIVERIFPADQVPFAEGRFIIEPGVEAFSALLFHAPGGEPLALVAPDGSRYSHDDPPPGARWQVEPRFDLLRVPAPEAGEWRFEGEIGADSRVAVTSSVALQLSALPATLYLGLPVPIEAWLTREGEPWSEGLEALSIHVELRDSDDGVQAALRLVRQGERFVGELPAPALPGSARLLVRAEAEGFARQRAQAVSVLPAIEARHQPAASRVVLRTLHPELGHATARPWGVLAGEELAADPVGEGEWHLALPELDPSVSQPLLLAAEVTLDGETRELRLPRLLLFPEAEIGLGLAGAPGPRPLGDRFHEDLATGREAAEEPPSAADRFVAFVNALPGHATALWQEGRPGLERRAEAFARDPRQWAMAGLALLLLLTLMALRRTRRRRRVTHREDPHV